MAVYDNFFSKKISKNIKRNNKNYKLFKTPVLFIIFNRPNTTQKVFDVIKKIKPKYLFIAADGPRSDKPGEIDLCKQTRNIIKQVNWNCNLTILNRDTNFGCGRAVSSAITWFFNQVDHGIILEDDCLPDITFFNYCQNLLEKYKNTPQIMHITGYQFIQNYQSSYSYYFAKNMHCWGWASWSDRWKFYDFDLSDYSENNFKNLSSNKSVITYWISVLNMMKRHEIDTWDYQWAFAIIANKGLCINPSKNLVTNIGFGNSSTHTSEKNNPSANLPTYPLKKIFHPNRIKVDDNAVNTIFSQHYNINLDQPVSLYETLNNLIKKAFKKF